MAATVSPNREEIVEMRRQGIDLSVVTSRGVLDRDHDDYGRALDVLTRMRTAAMDRVHAPGWRS